MAELRLVLRILALAVLFALPQAAAQTLPGLPGQQAAAPAEPPPPSTGIDRDAVEDLIRTLEDDAERSGLVRQLRALLEAGATASTGPAPQEEAAEAKASPGAPVREAIARARPMAAEVLAGIEQAFRDRWALLRGTWRQMANSWERLPGVIEWSEAALDEPAERRAFGYGLGRVLTVLALAMAFAWFTAVVLRPVRAALRARPRGSIVSRLVSALTLFVIRLVPVLIFILAVSILIVLLRPDEETRTLVTVGAASIAIVRAGVLLAHVLLAPDDPSARLLPVSDGTARNLSRYVHWLLSVFVYGRAAISVLRWEGMPLLFQASLHRLVALVLFASAVWIVLRHRRGIGRAIERLADGVSEQDAWRIPWRWIGAIWHLFAIFLLFSLFAVFVVEGDDLFVGVLTTVATSLAILAVLVAALRYVERGSQALGLMAAEAGVTDADDEPDAAERAEGARRRRVRPTLIVLRVAILVVAVLTVLDVWGVRTWGRFFEGQTGLGGRLFDFVVILMALYVIWWVVNRLITRAIRNLDDTGSERSSNRARTVLVLGRNVTLITLGLIGILLFMSELGVNIGPLLAGAGVLGIAVGFGSQRLVQDVISGAFNLVEDTFAVGDVVDLSGKVGVVEAVTIRTVRLRDVGGNVHTIPFGAIDVVTNMTKDFSYAMFDLGIAYREQVDEVMKVVQALGDEMRRDRAYRRVILEPMEMLGVDAFADSAVMIKCRMKVRPAAQWMIQREFRRRLKNRFDELGIEIPFPHQTLYFGQDRSGAAPPVHVALEERAESVAETAQVRPQMRPTG